MTLAFLGHRPEADVERIAAVVREAPDRRAAADARPRARAAAEAPADADRRDRRPQRDPAGLQAWLSRELAAAGAARARGAGVPPARDRGAAAAGRARDGRAKMPGPAPVTFYGEAVTLYRSQLRREGARYEPLARLPLREWSSRPPGLRDRTRVAAMRSGVRWAATIGAAALTLLAAAAPATARLRWSGCGDVEAECARAARAARPLRRDAGQRAAAGRPLRAAEPAPDAALPLRRPGRRRRAGVLRRAVRGRRAVAALRPRLLRPARDGRLGPAALPRARARRAPALDRGRRGLRGAPGRAARLLYDARLRRGRRGRAPGAGRARS